MLTITVWYSDGSFRVFTYLQLLVLVYGIAA